MSDTLPRWLPWIFAIRGVLAIILGLLMILNPLAGLATFILFFGAFTVAEGILAVIGAVSRRGGGAMDWPTLLYGLATILMGALILMLPGLTLTAFILVAAIWMIVMGIVTLISSGRWRRSVAHPWVVILLAIFSILFGLYLLFFPLAGIAAIPFTVGAFALAWGALMLGVAFQLWARRGRSGAAT